MKNGQWCQMLQGGQVSGEIKGVGFYHPTKTPHAV